MNAGIADEFANVKIVAGGWKRRIDGKLHIEAIVNDKRKQSLRGARATCLRAEALRRASVAIL